MVNADSWQSSVIELAQAGNLRAITFWINRYLVPQGICAQVQSERPGHLIIRTVCHHPPDADRLVRFICQRLVSLNSQVIQTVRITTQLVGSSQILWMKSARLAAVAPSTQAVQSVAALPSQPPSHLQNLTSHQAGQRPESFPTTGAGQSATRQVADANAPHGRSASSSHAPQLSQSPRRTQPIQFIENPRPGAVPIRGAASTAQPAVAPRKKQPIASRKKKPGRSLPQRPLWVRLSRTTVRQVAALPQTMRLLSTQSIDWFAGQTLPVRTLTLGGSAVAVFFIGCGFELMRQYVVDPGFRESTSAAYTPKNTAGTVNAALERVPIIRADVSDPDDPAVTLLFSNSAALGQVSKAAIGSMSGANLDGASRASSGGMPAYRRADLIMTSLDNSLSLQQLLPASSRNSRESGNFSQASLPVPEQEASPGRDRSLSASATDRRVEGGKQTEGETTIHELLANGIDIVNLANKQAPAGAESAELVQTIDVLNRSEIQALGAGNDATEARRPRIFDVKGQRIAYLGYAKSSPPAEAEAAEDETIEDQATEDSSVEIAEATTEEEISPELIQQLTEDIQAIRDQVDWVVVSFHWQQNLRAYPEAWQSSLARLAIDQGADLVVGYHPKLTQGAEIYKGRAIAYSLGSSIAEYVSESDAESTSDRDTVTLRVSLQDQHMKLEFLPVQIRDGEATLAKAETAKKILRNFEQASSFFDQPIKSKTVLDARVRMSLPAAPDAELPTEPFLAYPESPQEQMEEWGAAIGSGGGSPNRMRIK